MSPKSSPSPAGSWQDDQQGIEGSASPLLVSVEYVAQLLSASTRTVRRLDAAGKLPAGVRVGGLKRWRRREIEAWITAGCPQRSHWRWNASAM